MIFYTRNVVKFYSLVGDIKTMIIRCLKATNVTEKMHAYLQTLEVLKLYKVLYMVI